MPAKTINPAAASRQALADAKAKADTWTADHAAAVESAEELIARLVGGDDAVTAAELLESEYAVKRAELLSKAGTGLVARAERALVNDDTRLGNLFADALDDALDRLVPVQVVTVATEVKPYVKGEPVLYVLQEKPTTDHGGIYSGELKVTYYRSTLLAPLDIHRVELAAAKRGHKVDITPWGSQQIGDQYQDVALIRVHEAAPEVPILTAAPSDETVRHFAQGVTGRLRQCVRTAPQGVRLMGESPERNASAELASLRIGDTTTADDGERLIVALSVRVTPSPRLTGNPYPRLEGVLQALHGLVESGLGRVVAVEGVQIDVPERDHADYRKPWTATARVVIAYRVAAA